MNAPMKTEVVMINPEMAERYLGRNLNNRPLSESWAKELARRIKRNEWKLNGEAIKFSSDGYLLDGQHRLKAIIISGTSVPVLLIRGVDRSSFDTMDQGKSRGAADILAINGEKNANLIASAAKIVFLFKENKENPVFNNRVTPIQIEKTLALYPEIRQSAAVAEKVKKILIPSVAASLWVLFWQKDRDLANEFFARLEDGAGLSKHHPIKTLRDRLIINSASITRLRQKILCAFVIKTWNAVRAGKEMRICKFAEDEKFPEII